MNVHYSVHVSFYAARNVFIFLDKCIKIAQAKKYFKNNVIKIYLKNNYIFDFSTLYDPGGFEIHSYCIQVY